MVYRTLKKYLPGTLATLVLALAGAGVLLSVSASYVAPTQSPPQNNLTTGVIDLRTTAQVLQAKLGPLSATQFQDADNNQYFFDPRSSSVLGDMLSMEGHFIKNVALPNAGANQDGANKGYVDSVFKSPTATISATPSSSIQPGQSGTINWSSTGANSCTVYTPFSTAWPGTSGSQNTGVLVKSATYTLACENLVGSAFSSATVSVTLPDIKANGSDVPINLILYPGPATASFTWTPVGVASVCTVTGTGGVNWTNATSPKSITYTSSSIGSNTYTISCTSQGATVSDSVQVNVTLPTPFTFSSSGGSGSNIQVTCPNITGTPTTQLVLACTAADLSSGNCTAANNTPAGNATAFCKDKGYARYTSFLTSSTTLPGLPADWKTSTSSWFCYSYPAAHYLTSVTCCATPGSGSTCP